MQILLLGSGGREHALATAIVRSPHCTQLHIAPGNAGTASLGINVQLSPTDFTAVSTYCRTHHIDMVIVGPEEPLVKGIVDYFQSDPELRSIPVIGPPAAGARLEGSKAFAKSFLQRHRIPTAAYGSFDSTQSTEALRFLESLKPPYVIKADGLAAGKGVVIVNELDAARAEVNAMLLDDKFGAAGHTVVIEEFLQGIELSVFVLTDGDSYVILPEAKDYKRIGEQDTGLNTGGMGAVSPVPFADSLFMKKVEERIVRPTIDGLKSDGIPYRGWIFIGLMKCGDDPFVIEYNVRMGDPETEVVFPRIQSDVLDMLWAVAQGELRSYELSIDPRTAMTVMLVSGGYPEAYEKGKTITGIDQVEGCMVFHAGTAMENGHVVTQGGRVLAVTALEHDLDSARNRCYAEIGKIAFEKMYYRRDIGNDLR